MYNVVVVLMLRRSLQKRNSPSFQIGSGMKFDRIVPIVPQVNTHRLTKSNFRYDVILSRWRLWPMTSLQQRATD